MGPSRREAGKMSQPEFILAAVEKVLLLEKPIMAMAKPCRASPLVLELYPTECRTFLLDFRFLILLVVAKLSAYIVCGLPCCCILFSPCVLFLGFSFFQGIIFFSRGPLVFDSPQLQLLGRDH